MSLENVKIGDKVLLYHCPTWGKKTCKIGIVSKVNKVTFQIEQSCFTFRKDTGHVYGDAYSNHFINLYDEEKYQQALKNQEEIKKRNDALFTINKTTFRNLSTEKLVKIAEIINS